PRPPWKTAPSGRLYQCPDCESWTINPNERCDNSACSTKRNAGGERDYPCDDCGDIIRVKVDKDGNVIDSGSSAYDAESGERIRLDTLCDVCAEAWIHDGRSR